MTRRIHISYSVANTAILAKTLDDMGIQHSEHGDSVIVILGEDRSADFDTKNSRISFDEADQGKVNAIKQNYAVNFYKDQAIREGMKLTEAHSACGTVTLRLTRQRGPSNVSKS